MKKVAFTLAETLITIGMIGVIAALTLPTLMNSTNEKEIVARVKKVHAISNEAYGRAYAKYAPIDTWVRSTDSTPDLKAERIGNILSEFMQIEKNCKINSGTGCFPVIHYIADDEESNYGDGASGFYKVILSDGVALSIECEGLIYIDIDGPKKGKNTMGIDVFRLEMSENKIWAGTSSCTGNSCREGIGGNCACWILNYDNADYINCTDLTDSNPTCN